MCEEKSHLNNAMLREKDSLDIFPPYITLTYISTWRSLSCWYTPCLKEGAKDS